MAMKLSTSCVHWFNSLNFPQFTLPYQTPAFSILSCSSKRTSRTLDGSSFFRNQPSTLYGPVSLHISKSKILTLTRSSSSGFNPSMEEEFAKKIQELSLTLKFSDIDTILDLEFCVNDFRHSFGSKIPCSIEFKANGIDFPLSLQIIETGESVCCSMKEAFSSMACMIREIYSYTLQMREILCYEDLQGAILRMHKDIHDSFVWLFHQAFSCTPTLMIYLMILLANFTVHSMERHPAFALSTRTFTIENLSEIETNGIDHFKTELVYRNALAHDPNNVLLLTNFAQFLYVAMRDYDRAEEYFKKAVGIVPSDAEAYSKYANYLWMVKKDLWAAEELFLDAISIEPSNSYHAANYAHFLWNTGGEETCFPLT